MRTLSSVFFVATALTLAACGGGAGATALPAAQASPTATPSSTTAPSSQATSAPLSASTSTTVQVGTSTLTFPAAGASNTVTVSLATSAPSGVTAPAVRSSKSQRIATLGVQSTFGYFTLQFAQNITISQGIGFVVNLPSAPNGNWYVLFLDPSGQIANGWSEVAPFTISGSVLTATPGALPAPLTLRANQPYYFAIASTGSNPIATPTASPSSSPTTAPTATPTATPAASATINPAAIPLGGQYSDTTPQVGYVYACNASFNGQGANVGPWINISNNTWDSTTKLHTQGSVSWPNASNSFTTTGSNVQVTSNDLPVNELTGTYPIALSDPAHQYDGNPNSITAQSLSLLIPLSPAVATRPSCLPMGAIGITNDGVVFFDSQDAAGRDAGAYEVVDACNGHPESSGMYHYHSINTACITDTHDADGHSGQLGYAFDGFGIYGPDDVGGAALVDASLDECHGHTHAVMFHGTMQAIYHYHITTEYPYTLGCYKGTPASGY